MPDSIKRSSKTVGPNRLPEGDRAKATAAAAAASAALTAAESGCRFLGQDFAEGDTICYRSKVWICSGGSWARTSVNC
jgi:hypothetical protein